MNDDERPEWAIVWGCAAWAGMFILISVAVVMQCYRIQD